MRVQVGAAGIYIYSITDQNFNSFRFAIEGAEDEGEQSLGGAGGGGERGNLLEIPEVEGGGQREGGSPLDGVFSGGEMGIDQGIIRDALDGGAGVDQHVHQRDLYLAVVGDAGPGYEEEGIIELFLQAGHLFFFCLVYDGGGEGGDICRELFIPDGVFRYEPEQIGLAEESVESAADLFA